LLALSRVSFAALAFSIVQSIVPQPMPQRSRRQTRSGVATGDAGGTLDGETTERRHAMICKAQNNRRAVIKLWLCA
jgi:hypothetical protein